jgi:hypothetical protein
VKEKHQGFCLLRNDYVTLLEDKRRGIWFHLELPVRHILSVRTRLIREVTFTDGYENPLPAGVKLNNIDGNLTVEVLSFADRLLLLRILVQDQWELVGESLSLLKHFGQIDLSLTEFVLLPDQHQYEER